MITQPTKITYILQWGDAATLGLIVRDPHGTVVRDESSSDSPLRVNLQADTMGDWICQVKGIRVPSRDFPYVLTLARE